METLFNAGLCTGGRLNCGEGKQNPFLYTTVGVTPTFQKTNARLEVQ
jgi:hypothetical protein